MKATECLGSIRFNHFCSGFNFHHFLSFLFIIPKQIKSHRQSPYSSQLEQNISAIRLIFVPSYLFLAAFADVSPLEHQVLIFQGALADPMMAKKNYFT